MKKYCLALLAFAFFSFYSNAQRGDSTKFYSVNDKGEKQDSVWIGGSGPLLRTRADTLERDLQYARAQAELVNAVIKPPAHYTQIPRVRWGYWGIGAFEEVAYAKDNIVIAIHSYTGFAAPPAYFRKPDYTHESWAKMHNNRLDSIAKSFADNGFPCTPVATKDLKKVNADRGYIFTQKFKPERLYRDKYPLAKFVLLQKDDLGRLLIVYYYMPSEEKNVNKAIKESWGAVTFNADDKFYRDQTRTIGMKTIYLGKFSYANDPEVVKRDSLEFEKRKQQLLRKKNK